MKFQNPCSKVIQSIANTQATTQCNVAVDTLAGDLNHDVVHISERIRSCLSPARIWDHQSAMARIHRS